MAKKYTPQQREEIVRKILLELAELNHENPLNYEKKRQLNNQMLQLDFDISMKPESPDLTIREKEDLERWYEKKRKANKNHPNNN